MKISLKHDENIDYYDIITFNYLKLFIIMELTILINEKIKDVETLDNMTEALYAEKFFIQ